MDNKDLHFLHKAIFGKELNEIKEADAVISMLEKGETDILMSLKWDEKRGEHLHDYHTIVLQNINDKERIVFYNTMGHDDVAGTLIKGENKGPERLVEDTGLESVAKDDFIRFFQEREAVCFVSQ